MELLEKNFIDFNMNWENGMCFSKINRSSTIII